MTARSGALRAVHPNGEKAKGAVFSAHLGFRGSDMPIEIYDARMGADDAGIDLILHLMDQPHGARRALALSRETM